DTVSGHRHELAAPLQRLNDLELVRGGHPGEDVDLASEALQDVGADLNELGGLEDADLSVPHEVEVAADGRGRPALVPRDDDDPDSRLPARGDRFADTFPDRIDQRDQADPDQAFVAILGTRRIFPERQSEDAHAAIGHTRVRAQYLRTDVGRQG